MSIVLIIAKAISLIVVTVAAFLALAGALGVDLASEATTAQCAMAAPRICLFMIM